MPVEVALRRPRSLAKRKHLGLAAPGTRTMGQLSCSTAVLHATEHGVGDADEAGDEDDETDDAGGRA